MIPILVTYVLPILHVLACFFLIVVVLLQTGKGADMGAVFGGSSQTLFGSTGAGNFLTKLTTGVALTFMATSLFLAMNQRATPGSSIINRLPAPGEAPPAAAVPMEGAPAPEAAPAPAPEPQANAGEAAPANPAAAPAPAPEAAPAAKATPPADSKPADGAPATP